MNIIKILVRLTRVDDWMYYIGVAIFGFFLSVPDNYGSLIPVLAVLALTAAFGFSINDYFDARFDKLKTETKNVISLGIVKKRTAGAFCTLISILMFTIGALFLTLQTFILVTILYFIFYAYSSPPFRLKEKGVPGLLSHGAFIALFILIPYTTNSGIDLKIIMFTIVIFILSIVVDLTQEIRDMGADKKSGFKTVPVSIGYEKTFSLIKFLSVSSFCIFIIAVLVYMPLYALVLMTGSIFYLRVLFGKTNSDSFFRESINAWRKGVVITVIIGLILLPFYIGWI